MHGITKRPFTSGNFGLVLDGQPDFASIRSVSGGSAKGAIIAESVGPDMSQFKHLGAVEIDPISLELDLAVSKNMMRWIQSSWRQDFHTKNGALLHFDSDYKVRLEQRFRDALITETTFPAMDANGQADAYLKIAFLPEWIGIVETQNPQRRPFVEHEEQRDWSANSFRFEIDGIDCTGVTRIESFSVKQEVKQLHVGSRRFPEISPTQIEFSNLTVEVDASRAGEFIAWHERSVLQGARDPEMERTGAITFLNQKGDKDLFSINLERIGLYNLSIAPSKANEDKVKSLKVEFYVESMDLKLSGSGLR